MYILTSIFSCTLLLPSVVFGLVARSTLPPQFIIDFLGNASDSSFPHVYRDGGCGGTVGGKHIIVYCDTSTTIGTNNDKLIGFTSNSIAIWEDNSPTPQLRDFGSNGVPKLAVPFETSESSYTTNNFDTTGDRVVIWPGASITAIGDGSTGLSVFPVAIWGPGGKGLYNTLVTVTVNETGPTIERTVPQLISAPDIQYGNFGTVLGVTGKLILIAQSAKGLKIAHVDPADAADVSKYEYWLGAGAGWSTTAPADHSTDANIFTSWIDLSSGDIFWSDYYKTFLAVYFLSDADSTFYIRYALEGHVAGAWSDEQVLYKTTPAPGQYNYAGHAQPTWDPTGATLTLSWSWAGAFSQMAIVTWR